MSNDTPIVQPAPTVIDVHCHIASSDHIPASFIEAAAANMAVELSSQGVEVSASRITRLYLDKLRDPLCDDLVAEMDAAGIASAVLLVPDFTYALRDCRLTIEESLIKHHEVLQRHPGRFRVFAGVDPRWGRDGVDLFQRAVEQFGGCGFKIYPPCGLTASAREFDPFYEICATYHLPVLVHMGPTAPVLGFDTSHPFTIDDAARRFPAVDFILAHAAMAFPHECTMLCRFRPNVWMDISGYQMALGWDPQLRAVQQLVTCGVLHKVMFGTDWPVFRMYGTQKTFVEALTRDDGPLASLSERQMALLFGENAKRLLARASVTAPSLSGQR
jgi:predicted TIM-barrel fold metal-dependent hydrolase